MRTLITILTGILALSLLAAPVATAAQDVDIPGLADTTGQVSPKEIQAALHTPISDDLLPAEFSNATLIDQNDTTMQAEETGAAHSVTWSITYTPGDEITPEAQTPSRASEPGRLYNTASISYLIFDDILTPDALAGLDETLRASIGDQAAHAEAQEITIADQPARFISIETETNGIPIIMDWVAVPVGNVAVVSMTMSGGEAVDRDALLDDVEALSLAAIEHLQVSVEQRGTPVG